MKKRGALITLLTVFVSALAVFFVTGGQATALAAEGNFSVLNLTVTSGGQTLSNVSTDPFKYVDDAAGGMLIDGYDVIDDVKMGGANPIIFTAVYPYTTTRRMGDFTEYTVLSKNGKYIVEAVNSSGDGSTYIPVGGFVLSVPGSSAFTLTAGAELTVSGSKKLNLATMAVENESGNRISVDNINAVRSAPMTVYYDYDFGSTTGTNDVGTEMAAVFDFESGKFVVTAFRGFGVGGHTGMQIPDNGFVLSCYGEGYRGRLIEGKRFNIGDKLTLQGFEYIRFGGAPVTYNYDYDYRDAQSPTDEWNGNPLIWEWENVPFPAYRGTDQMIIYHHGWSYNDAKGTGTNVYGFEAAVDADGNVVERAVNVSSIPEGGYVISGHGKGRDFIRSSIPLGARVEIDTQKNTISISTSLNSFYVNTKSVVEGIVNSAKTKIEQLYDLDVQLLNQKIAAVEELMTLLEEYKLSIEQKTEEESWTSELEKTGEMMLYNAAKLQAEKVAYEILSLSAESKPVSARAVWHRPTEKSLDAINETMQTYVKTGINLIFVETFFNGYGMYKGSMYVDYHKDFASASYGEYDDYLSAFVAVATQNGIEVHAWVEDFYVGLDSTIPLLANREDWIIYNADGTYIQKNEGGDYIFIDPANEEVQDFLIDYYSELLIKHPDIKGLNLDYIRYPVSDAEEDTGFSKHAMMEFAREIGIENRLNESMTIADMIAEFNKRAFNSAYTQKAEENYQKWCDYRMGKVTGFVERIYNEIKKPMNAILSTSVFSSITETKASKKQDWQTWFRNGWIDIATPMAYYDSSADVLLQVSNMITAAGTKCYYYAGLASSFRGLPAYENVYQIEASYNAGAAGYVIFCSTQIMGHEDVQGVLSSGFNSAPAVLPHHAASKVINAYFKRITQRAQDIYIPANGMTQTQLDELTAELEDIKQMPTATYEELVAVRKVIRELYQYDALTDYAKGYAVRRMEESFKELDSILSTKISILASSPQGGLPENPSSETQSSGSSSTGSGSQDDGGNDNIGLIIGISAAAVAVIAGVVVAVILLRKKKANK